MRLKIYGYSDDLLEIDGDLRSELNVDTTDNIMFGIINSANEGVTITGHYGDTDCWEIGATLLKEGKGIPEGWHISIEWDESIVDYSPILLLDTGHDTVTIRH